MTKKSKIILPESVMEKELEEYVVLAGKSLMQEANKKIQGKKCKGCKRSDKLKVIPLFEDPHPFASRIVLFCDACKRSETLMDRKTDKQMQHHVKYINKMLESTLPPIEEYKTVTDPKVVDKLIKPKPNLKIKK